MRFFYNVLSVCRLLQSTRLPSPARGRRCLAFVEPLEVRVLLTAAARPLNSGLDSLWQQVESFPATDAHGVSYLNLSDYTALTINDTVLRQALDAAPDEEAFNFSIDTNTLTLVDPDGNLERFAIYETAIMAPELAAQFPNIKTYAGQGIDDSTAAVQLDLTPQGFHAQVLSEGGRWYVDPYFHLNDDFYASYYAADAIAPAETRAARESELNSAIEIPHPSTASTSASSPLSSESPEVVARSGTQLRTYRAAVAANGEYTAFHGGTVNLGQAAIVTAINRVSGIYETELSIRLQLIANNASLVYTNAATDPYSNTSGTALIHENQANIDSVIGSANYDIGHLFNTGGGGLAGVGVVGQPAVKAWGETGQAEPIGGVFYIDFVAHEMGHQFGANHTFNTSANSQRNAGTAYEPGSGSTIMGYAGVISTESENLQANSDAYFHSVSFDEIIAYVDNAIPTVGTRTATGNNIPTINAGTDYTIPSGTTFTLTAIGADADGTESLTYNWEERDLGAAQLLTDPDNGSSPLFRSVKPTSDPSRTFRTTLKGEKLPTTTRDLKFRATVRDNRPGGGGVNTDDMVVHVVFSGLQFGAGFSVASPGTGITWAQGSTQTVSWNVAGSNANGINVANVRILLSTDGGATFGTVLANSTPNDGSAQIVVPNTPTTQARLKVEAIGNIFFDVSDANFTIPRGTSHAPEVDDQTFTVPENRPYLNTVGTVIASDIDVGQTLTYEIIAGNDNNAFGISYPLYSPGTLHVNNPAALSVQPNRQFVLTVRVTDSGTPALSDTAFITINVTNGNGVPSVGLLFGSPFNLVENTSTSSRVYMDTIVVTDEGLGTNSLSLSGADAGFFELDSSDLYLKAGTALNYNLKSQYVVTISVDDPMVGGTPDDSVTFTLNIIDIANVRPLIGGAVANQPLNDNATRAPFASLTVTDPDQQEMLAKVTILNGVVRGDFTAASTVGWTRSVAGNNITYSRYYNPVANIGSVVQAAVRALVFRPRSNAIRPGTTETTAFTVFINDGEAPPVSNSASSVVTTSVNNVPAISGAIANQPVDDYSTIKPFGTMTVTDPDVQDMLVKVTILNGGYRGFFAPESIGGWTRTDVGNNTIYTRYFSATANIGSVVQAAIRALVFQPRANVIKPNTTETTAFTVFLNDGLTNTTNTATTVVSTSLNDVPTIGGATANQAVNDNATKAIFSTLTVTDRDTQDMLAKVTILNGVNRGDFTAASTVGWTRTVTGNNILYSRYYSPRLNIGSTVQVAIRALIFQPRSNVPIGQTETTVFTVFVNDGLANVSNSTTSVITTGVAPRFTAVLPMTSSNLEGDVATIIVPTVKRPAANPLARLLRKSR